MAALRMMGMMAIIGAMIGAVIAIGPHRRGVIQYQ
jgi:hypothetical protein